ncbi:MAG TPA: hypothetical protein VL995_00110 [Cellvibrio sp.]|nr:hypothetical protein [Cellvibrio sp.]
MFEFTIKHCNESENVDKSLTIDFTNKLIKLDSTTLPFIAKPIIQVLWDSPIAIATISIKLNNDNNFIFILAKGGFLFSLNLDNPPFTGGRKVGGGGDNTNGMVGDWFTAIESIDWNTL